MKVFGKKACSGFTMIELMAAMAILIMITLFVGRIFSDTSKIFTLGTRRMIQAMDGRAVVDFMVREMSSAVFDDVLVFAHKPNAKTVLGMDSDFVYFVSSEQQAQPNGSQPYRQVKQVSYHIEQMQDYSNTAIPNRFAIVRDGRNTMGANYTCYTDPTWWQASYMTDSGSFSGSHVVLAENVRTLEFWMYDTAGQLIKVEDSSAYINGAYTSDNARKLGWVEIYIELLGEEDAIKCSLLSGQAAIDFADRSSRRYVGRVYFQNGRGYGSGT